MGQYTAILLLLEGYPYFTLQSCFNSFTVQLAWLPVQEGSDLNLPVEPKRTCYNLWAISVLPFIFRPALPVLLVLLPAADLRPAQRGFFTLNRIKAGKMGVHSSLPTKAVITAPDPTPAISLLIFFFFFKERGKWRAFESQCDNPAEAAVTFWFREWEWNN